MRDFSKPQTYRYPLQVSIFTTLPALFRDIGIPIIRPLKDRKLLLQAFLLGITMNGVGVRFKRIIASYRQIFHTPNDKNRGVIDLEHEDMILLTLLDVRSKGLERRDLLALL